MSILQSMIGGLWRRGAMAAGYDAAERSYKRRNMSGERRSNKDEDNFLTAYARAEIVARCIDLARNNMIVSGVVDRMCDHVIGGGIMPQARTSSEAWNDEAEAFFGEWTKVCDSRQRINMEEFQRNLLAARFLSGDCGIVLTDGGQLQPVESLRIGTPKSKLTVPSPGIQGGRIVEGIEVNDAGIPLRAYVLPRNSDGSVDANSTSFDTVPFSDFIHVTRNVAGRFDQVRGVPMLAPVVNALQDFGEVSSAMVIRAKMDAFRAWQVTTQDGTGPGNLGDRNAKPSVGGQSYEKFDEPKTYYMGPGEEAKSLASNTPNPQHVGFMVYNLRLIGSSIGIPYEFLLLDFSQGNYSVSRAALLETHQTFAKWQRWLALYMQRIWNWRIAKAIKAREIGPAPVVNGVSEWYKVKWQFPEFGWVDPQNEATANQTEYNLCVSSLTDIAAKKGRVFDDIVKQKAAEIEAAMIVAKELRERTGEFVSWQNIISSSVPGGMPLDPGTPVKRDASGG